MNNKKQNSSILNHTQYRSDLRTWEITEKRVIVRADLNITYNHTVTPPTIVDDFRLRSLLPTIDLILQKQGRIILITHIDRPEQPTPALSTSHLVSWFKKHTYDITYAASIEQACSLNSPIILLENIRFFPGEKNHDPLFAQQLARLGDFYVNDGFGVMHRTDTSVTLLPLLFSSDKRTFGLLVEKELNELTPLLHAPQKPFVLIMGGAKVTEKIAIMEHMLHVIDSILLCPALVFTFNKARGKSIGNSLVENQTVTLCNHIMEQADKKKIPILFPVDYQVAIQSPNHPTTLAITHDDTIKKNEIGISIGPKTIQAFSPIIHTAGTIFLNGSMGFANKPKTMQGMYSLLDVLATAQGKTIVAGGDSVAAVFNHGTEHHIDYLSTGGGSALAYMSGQQLPGLEILKKRTKTE